MKIPVSVQPKVAPLLSLITILGTQQHAFMPQWISILPIKNGEFFPPSFSATWNFIPRFAGMQRRIRQELCSVAYMTCCVLFSWVAMLNSVSASHPIISWMHPWWGCVTSALSQLRKKQPQQVKWNSNHRRSLHLTLILVFLLILGLVLGLGFWFWS